MNLKKLHGVIIWAVIASGATTIGLNAQASSQAERLSSTSLQEETPKGIEKSFRLTLNKSPKSDSDYSFTVLIDNKNQTATLITKIHNKEENTISQSEHSLTMGQVNNVLRFERASNFWQLPASIKRNVLDGASWTLEGVDGNKYHRTSRRSPLPPYYSKIIDPATDNLIKDPNTPPERESKPSDEVGLDMFCMLIMLMHPGYDELIY